MLRLARLLCQSPRNMQVSHPSNFALATAHFTKFRQSSLWVVLLDLSPKWMSVKIAALRNRLVILAVYYSSRVLTTGPDMASMLCLPEFCLVHEGLSPFISRISSRMYCIFFSMFKILVNELVIAAV